LSDLRKAKHRDRIASPEPPEPTSFPAHSRLSLCKGWCCKNGDDDAFLDDRTLTRVRLAKPEMTERTLLRLHLAAARRRGAATIQCHSAVPHRPLALSGQHLGDSPMGLVDG
jgi:hypothetical protein